MSATKPNSDPSLIFQEKNVWRSTLCYIYWLFFFSLLHFLSSLTPPHPFFSFVVFSPYVPVALTEL